MIPTIGLMIGAYIITRMLAVVSRSGDRAETTLTRIFAGLTILVAAWGMAELITTSRSLPDLEGVRELITTNGSLPGLEGVR